MASDHTPHKTGEPAPEDPTRHSVNNPVKLLPQWFIQADSPANGWDATPLVVACQQLANQTNASIGHMHVMIPYPKQGDGARPIVEFAESLACRFGLRAQCVFRRNNIVVTFERLGAD